MSMPMNLAALDGPWVDQWLTPPRLATYLRAAGGSRETALRLYEWNHDAANAIHRDLGHFEVGLRNAYDHALRAHWTGPADWTDSAPQLFPPRMGSRGKPKVSVDLNATTRALLVRARQDAGGVAARPEKVVAELTLGFWRYLSIKRQESALWIPYLRHAFPAGTDRARDVDGPVGRIHDLRNRVAHHEPLLNVNLARRHSDIIDLADLISPDLGSFVARTSTLPEVLARRPIAALPPKSGR